MRDIQRVDVSFLWLAIGKGGVREETRNDLAADCADVVHLVARAGSPYRDTAAAVLPLGGDYGSGS